MAPWRIRSSRSRNSATSISQSHFYDVPYGKTVKKKNSMKRDWNWSHRYGKRLFALLAEFQSWFNYDTAILNDAIQLCKGNVRWLTIPSSKHNHSPSPILSPLITKTLDHDIIWPEARDEIKECKHWYHSQSLFLSLPPTTLSLYPSPSPSLSITWLSLPAGVMQNEKAEL